MCCLGTTGVPQRLKMVTRNITNHLKSLDIIQAYRMLTFTSAPAVFLWDKSKQRTQEYFSITFVNVFFYLFLGGFFCGICAGTIAPTAKCICAMEKKKNTIESIQPRQESIWRTKSEILLACWGQLHVWRGNWLHSRTKSLYCWQLLPHLYPGQVSPSMMREDKWSIWHKNIQTPANHTRFSLLINGISVGEGSFSNRLWELSSSHYL